MAKGFCNVRMLQLVLSQCAAIPFSVVISYIYFLFLAHSVSDLVIHQFGASFKLLALSQMFLLGVW